MVSQKTSLPGLKNQSGVVLVFTLVILLLISLVGLSSLNASLTQEKMIHSVHAHNVTFQAAESALSHIETVLLEFSEDNGIPLSMIQKNSQQKTLNENQVVSLSGQDFILWQKGNVTDNSEAFKSMSSRSQWWQDQGTSYNNLKLEENGDYQALAVNSSMSLEQGDFIPDDLSMDSRAEFRGRQAFHGLVHAEGVNKQLESTLRTDLLVRY